MKRVIAIDGPAGSGKGTMARKLADHFGFEYLDTGILYRTIAYLKLNNTDTTYLSSIEKILLESKRIGFNNLQTDIISAEASEIAKNPHIRQHITQLIRDFISLVEQNNNIVILDGRDIGTIVAPDAFCKIFITADLDIRAQRRFESIQETKTTIDKVKSHIQKRDIQDQSREMAPLVCDNSYIILDTSLDNVEQSFRKLLVIVKDRLVLIQ